MVWVITGELNSSKQDGPVAETSHHLRPNRTYSLGRRGGQYDKKDSSNAKQTVKLALNDFQIMSLRIPGAGSWLLATGGHDWDPADEPSNPTNDSPYALTLAVPTTDKVRTLKVKDATGKTTTLSSDQPPLQLKDGDSFTYINCTATVHWRPLVVCFSKPLSQTLQTQALESAKAMGVKLASKRLLPHHTHFVLTGGQGLDINLSTALALTQNTPCLSNKWWNALVGLFAAPSRAIGFPDREDGETEQGYRARAAKAFPEAGYDIDNWYGHSKAEKDWDAVDSLGREAQYLVSDVSETAKQMGKNYSAADLEHREARKKVFQRVGFVALSSAQEASEEDDKHRLLVKATGGAWVLLTGALKDPLPSADKLMDQLDAAKKDQGVTNEAGRKWFVVPPGSGDVIFTFDEQEGEDDEFDDKTRAKIELCRDLARRLGTNLFVETDDLLQWVVRPDTMTLLAQLQAGPPPAETQTAFPNPTINEPNLRASGANVNANQGNADAGPSNKRQHSLDEPPPPAQQQQQQQQQEAPPPQTQGSTSGDQPPTQRRKRMPVMTFEQMMAAASSQPAAPEGEAMEVDQPAPPPARKRKRDPPKSVLELNADDPEASTSKRARTASAEPEGDMLPPVQGTSKKQLPAIAEEGSKGKKRTAQEAEIEEEDDTEARLAAKTAALKKKQALDLKRAAEEEAREAEAAAAKTTGGRKKSAKQKEKEEKAKAKDSDLLQVTTKGGKRATEVEKELNEEFNALQIKKPLRLLKLQKPKGQRVGWDDDDWDEQFAELVREDEERERRGEVNPNEPPQGGRDGGFNIIYADLIRKNPPGETQQQAASSQDPRWAGLPNFKRFTPKGGRPLVPRERPKITLVTPDYDESMMAEPVFEKKKKGKGKKAGAASKGRDRDELSEEMDELDMDSVVHDEGGERPKRKAAKAAVGKGFAVGDGGSDDEGGGPSKRRAALSSDSDDSDISDFGKDSFNMQQDDDESDFGKMSDSPPVKKKAPPKKVAASTSRAKTTQTTTQATRGSRAKTADTPASATMRGSSSRSSKVPETIVIESDSSGSESDTGAFKGFGKKKKR